MPHRYRHTKPKSEQSNVFSFDSPSKFYNSDIVSFVSSSPPKFKHLSVVNFDSHSKFYHSNIVSFVSSSPPKFKHLSAVSFDSPSKFYHLNIVSFVSSSPPPLLPTQMNMPIATTTLNVLVLEVTWPTVQPSPHAPSIAFKHLHKQCPAPWRKDVVNQCLEFAFPPPRLRPRLPPTHTHTYTVKW